MCAQGFLIFLQVVLLLLVWDVWGLSSCVVNDARDLGSSRGQILGLIGYEASKTHVICDVCLVSSCGSGFIHWIIIWGNFWATQIGCLLLRNDLLNWRERLSIPILSIKCLMGTLHLWFTSCPSLWTLFQMLPQYILSEESTLTKFTFIRPKTKSI